jgi:acyl-CoA thioester hydrolase
VTGRHAAETVIRVRYAETDQMRVAYHANYFVWFEVGRTDLLRRLGWSYREMEQAGFQLPVIEAHCRYVRSARYDEEIEIRTKAHLVSAVRVSFEYEAVRRCDQVVTATGRTLHATVNGDGRPCRLPERVRALFQ